ncbi:MAG: DUF3566 domain-containing protein [Actinobacteria bacterium]|nr:DUF3566 domain-containing protein [Actinomycetota bacterium]MBU1865927.1 DUF3566 domain-containing protein [Actinomycetota bacterium]
MPVQRVRRVLRKIDPWTVLKVSFVFNAILALIFVLGTVIFWSVFVNAGIPQQINELALLIGLENGFVMDGPTYFRVVLLFAMIGTILMTGFFTLAAVIYNLISDLVGGIEVVVLEETALPVATRPATPRGATTAPIRPLPTVKPMVRSRGRASTAETPAAAPTEDTNPEVEKTG